MISISTIEEKIKLLTKLKTYKFLQEKINEYFLIGDLRKHQHFLDIYENMPTDIPLEIKNELMVILKRCVDKTTEELESKQNGTYEYPPLKLK